MDPIKALSRAGILGKGLLNHLDGGVEILDDLADLLNKRNKIHHLDADTDEDMIPIFTHDVTGKARNNKRLLNRRNWCSIRMYEPGLSPPSTPNQSDESATPPPTRGGIVRR